MNKVIVIPKGFKKTKMHEVHNIKYFTPRIVSIKDGETISWINKDSGSHHLISGDIENGKPDGIFNSEIIQSQKCYSKKYDVPSRLIRYYCVIHPAEQGFIVINRTISGTNSDINSSEIKYLNKISSNVRNQSIESMLIRYVDPIILEIFNYPNLEIFRK